jgi:hypothetical protein
LIEDEISHLTLTKYQEKVGTANPNKTTFQKSWQAQRYRLNFLFSK